MADFLDEFIINLLHLEDGKSNRLIDLGDISCSTNSRTNEKSYLLNVAGHDSGEFMLDTIRARRGKSSNQTILTKSARGAGIEGNGIKWEWKDLNGDTDIDKLHKFIEDAYNEITLKGNNPLFLSVGSIKWNIFVANREETVYSPLLIFPIRLVRGATSPVQIDFVDEDAYFNPCFISLLRELYPDIANKFPHPNGKGADFDEAIDLDVLCGGVEYFKQVEQFIEENVSDRSTFVFDRDTVSMAFFNHSDICMYYDVRRNMERIYKSKLISKVFGFKDSLPDDELPHFGSVGELKFVLPNDSVQEKLISRVANGESLIIKGPPGTGKTLTIANMIATLLAQGKRVMFASKKISALAEVSNKLPENLRKFILMLAFETEKQSSSINPSNIRDELKAIVRCKRTYSRDNTLDAKLANARKSKYEAILKLDAYVKTVFGNITVTDKSYYDALDAYYKYSDLPIMEFAEAKDIANITADGLQRAKALATEAGMHFARLRGEKPVSYNPWLNVNGIDVNELYPIFSSICQTFAAASDALEKDKPQYDRLIESLPISILTTLAGQSVFDYKQIDSILALAKDEKTYKDVSHALADYRDKQKYATATEYPTEEELHDLVSVSIAVSEAYDKGLISSLIKLDGDNELTVGQLKTIFGNCDVFYKGGKLLIDSVALAKLLELVDKINENKAVSKSKWLDAITVFDKEIGEKQVKLLLKSYDVLKEYAEVEGEVKPSFKASHTAKKLSSLCTNALTTFQEIVKATVAYYDYYKNANEAASRMRTVSVILGSSKALISEEQYDSLALAVARSKALGKSLEKYLVKLEGSYVLLDGIDKGLANLPAGKTLISLIHDAELHVAKVSLKDAVVKACKDAEIELPDKNMDEVADAIAAALTLAEYQPVTSASEEQRLRLLETVVGIDGEIVKQLKNIMARLNEAKKKGLVNHYTGLPGKLTFEDLRYFVTFALDRGVAGSAIRYDEILAEMCEIMPVDKLFDELECGNIDVDTTLFAELLEHSFLSIVIRYRILQLGNARNGLGHNAVVELEKLDNAEKTIRELNAKLIEQNCLEKINPDDDDFGFLVNDKGAKLTMRALFKNFASAIWKLKRCFILSPSTASVLFRPEIYNDFDVVIVDEASQLEPVNLLPILVRSKQCVLVGDEHQMPPITHFKAKNNKLIEDYDRELLIDKDISALSLALVNQAFDTTELTCHYRSNTESLIAFSQKAFYPYMRTFPAALPFAEGLGFTDVYVPDGCCDGGVNVAEVNKTLELLRAHFYKHFDEENGCLNEGWAIGVVAFGESQLSAILRKVESDEKLFERISKARSAVDVGDKAVFFRTIESVQGQETDHLILSLTYGRDKNGKVQNRFGELNRDDLGKCIFNVAVTRARSSVTLVRSVEPHELDSSSRIGFIVEYMRLVKRFSVGDVDQFVSNPIGKGGYFVKEVARYVQSLGIAPERIIIGYGVTQGSVRMPIAILTPDLKSAALGVWCELPVERKYNYLDYNLRYYNSFESRNWNLHRVSIHEWFDNNEAEKKLLKNKIDKLCK